MFISLFWVSKIYNRQESDKIEFKEWDIATVTASDYTVRMKVKDHFYKNWLEHHYYSPFGDSQWGYPVGYSFKWLLKRCIENRVSEYKKKEILKDKEKGNESRFCDDPPTIVDIELAFNNGNIIKLLHKRGEYISKSKFAKVKIVDEKIKTICTEKQEMLTRPFDAFITWSKEEDKVAALEFGGGDGFTLFGDRLKLREAPDPTDVIWENRHRKRAEI
jgi:hypothetical protein